MMKIIVAEGSGLCYGVKRALAMARRIRRERDGRVATLGDLIHNPGVVADLEAQGIVSAASPEAIEPGTTVIIRSHGVSPALYNRLRRRRIDLVDATCPIVQKIQRLVADLAARRLEVVIVGDRGHPETQGLVGYSQGRGVVVESEAEARALPARKARAVLAQSTQDLGLLQRVTAVLTEKTRELTVVNTICDSTRTRQRATSDVAGRVDALFIVGGRMSSNTAQLYEMSRKIQPRTYFIESAAQITPDMLRGAETIGISGGASTPPEAIQEAVEAVERSSSQNSARETVS
jgi:(E)-4-hydroxy-3-methyl-but-2-enyl pyrophosphate reductase